MHPNLRGLDNTQTKGVKELADKYKNLIVISPESDIDSYALLDKCDKVIVFGSTIGIEASFWNKPVILIGRAEYEDLNACYIPQDYSEIISLITDKLEPLPSVNALKYGFYEKNKGMEIRNYNYFGNYNEGYFYFYFGDNYFIEDKPPEEVMKAYFNSYNLYKQAEDYRTPVFLALLITICRRLVYYNSNFSDILKYAQEARELAPDFPEAIFTIAFCKQNLNEIKEAIELYKKTENLFISNKYINPLGVFHNGQNLLTDLYFQLGRCFITEQKEKEALVYLEKAAQSSNNNQTILFHLIKYYLLTDNLAKAIEYYLMINQDLPENQKNNILRLANLKQDNPEFKKNQSELILMLKTINIWKKQEIEQLENKLAQIKLF